MDHADGRRIVLKVGGMTCAHCVARVRKALDETAGVASAEVDFASGMANIGIAGTVTSDDVIAAVEKAGYTATET